MARDPQALGYGGVSEVRFLRSELITNVESPCVRFPGWGRAQCRKLYLSVVWLIEKQPGGPGSDASLKFRTGAAYAAKDR